MKLFIEGSVDRSQTELTFMPDQLFIGESNADETDKVSDSVIRLYAFDNTRCECRVKGNRWTAQWSSIGLETAEGDRQNDASFEELKELIEGKLQLLDMVVSCDEKPVNVVVDNCEIIRYRPAGPIEYFHIDIPSAESEAGDESDAK